RADSARRLGSRVGCRSRHRVRAHVMRAIRRVAKADSWLLAGGVVAALNTSNAYRPFVKRGAPGIAAFVAGWPTSEAPSLMFAGEAATTALLASAGALRTRVGRVGFALELIAWAGLAGLAVEAQRSVRVLERALVDALGAGYRDELPQDARAEARLTISERT